MGSNVESMGTGDCFLNITLAAQTQKSFCKAKDIPDKTKWQCTEWEKIFTNLSSDRGLIFKIYKELKKLDIKIPNNLQI